MVSHVDFECPLISSIDWTLTPLLVWLSLDEFFLTERIIRQKFVESGFASSYSRSYISSNTCYACIKIFSFSLSSLTLFILFIMHQGSSCNLCSITPCKVHSRLLLNLHIHADIHDSWDNFHVITSWSTFWCRQRSFLGRFQRHSRCIILLFFVQTDRQAYCQLAVAWKTEIFSGRGI